MNFMSKKKEMVTHRKNNMEAFIKFKLLDSIAGDQIKILPGKFLEIVDFTNTPCDSYISTNFGNITLLHL